MVLHVSRHGVLYVAIVAIAYQPKPAAASPVEPVPTVKETTEPETQPAIAKEAENLIIESLLLNKSEKLLNRRYNPHSLVSPKPIPFYFLYHYPLACTLSTAIAIPLDYRQHISPAKVRLG
jgi:hypothetical protein